MYYERETFHWKKPSMIFKGVGMYHLTFTLRNRRPLLGTLNMDIQDPSVILSSLGRSVLYNLETYDYSYYGARIVDKIIMPDHIHVIMDVYQDYGYGIKRIGWYTCRGWYKISPDLNFAPPFIRTLSHKGQLLQWRNYIHDNPRRAIIKRNHPDLFYLRRNTTVQTANGQLAFSSMGNHFLLDYPLRQMVECSRSLTESQINEQMKQVIHLAEQGYVVYMAAISEGERCIARALREARLPLVILMPEGFPPIGHPNERFFKPKGVYFEACSAGHLLLLEPERETLRLFSVLTLTETSLQQKAAARHLPYSPIDIESERFRFMSLNTLAHLLSER